VHHHDIAGPNTQPAKVNNKRVSVHTLIVATNSLAITVMTRRVVEDAGYARLRAGTVADLLDRWLGQASPAWSSTTLAQTRSIVERHVRSEASGCGESRWMPAPLTNVWGDF
jgi:hypothetical protein